MGKRKNYRFLINYFRNKFGTKILRDLKKPEFPENYNLSYFEDLCIKGLRKILFKYEH
jgi:hypothetical protein